MRLIAYQVEDQAPIIRTGRPNRDWMDETQRRYAYLCLPLTMANRAGWELLNPTEFTAVWDGSEEASGVRIESDEPDKVIANSHFGNGVVTFRTGYIFRTESGCDLRVQGPPNFPKDGVCALEGIVETDWLPYTFTMNWKLTSPDRPVTFRAGDPFCFFYPFPTSSLLQPVSPSIRSVSDDQELEWQYLEWARSRRRFNSAREDVTSEEAKSGWNRAYLRGTTPCGQMASSHMTRPALAEFSVDEPSHRSPGLNDRHRM